MNADHLSAPPHRDPADDDPRAQATPSEAIAGTGEAQGAALGQAGEALVLQRPASGETVVVETAAGQSYVLDFAPTAAAVLIEGRNFVLAFDDDGDGAVDSRIVFRDLLEVVAAGEGPTFEIGGVAVDADILLGQAVALSGGEELPPDDVAAGPGAAGGGTSVYSDTLGEVLDLLSAQGVIPPVALQFGLPEPEDEATLLRPAADGEPAAPVLVVGENVNDNLDQTVPHRTPGDETGEIVGGDGDDVLIGDVGGHTLINKVMNLVLVLDTSNSMETAISFDGEGMMRIEALDRAVEEVLDALAGTVGATVRLHMVSFADNVKDQQTFDIIVDGVVDAAVLQAARDFILAAGDDPTRAAEGNTNYEAGFGAALDWFSDSGNTLDNSDYNRTIFISDGLPNRAFAGNDTTTVITPGSNAASLAHALGSGGGDTVSEVGGLLGSFEGVAATLDAVGINVDAGALALLDQVDGSTADSIDEGAALAALLGDLSQAAKLEAVGDDVLVGGDGDDLIFGDALFTDHLAADQGIALPAGSGWSVIEELAGNGFFDQDPLSSKAEEIIAFLRDPANLAAYDFGAESSAGGGRAGGADLILGGAGNDLIFAQEGSDTILGGAGDDTLCGGSDADVFAWAGDSATGETDLVTDFEAGPGGDVLDLSALLIAVAPGDGGDVLDAWLNFGFDGTATTLGIDTDGDGSGFTDVTISLEGVDLTGGSVVQADIIDSLLTSGNLQVA